MLPTLTAHAPPLPSRQTHAACLVISGNKSTLTQWHRLGVSAEKPWDSYENWGKWANPHGATRWAGKRYNEGSEGLEL